MLNRKLGTVSSQASTFHEAFQVITLSFNKEIERNLLAFKCLRGFTDLGKQDRYNVIKPGIMAVALLRTITAYFNDGHSQYMTVPTTVSARLHWNLAWFHA